MDRLLLEVSWEVCNKVGGIYTVLKEKSSYIVSRFKNSYFLIGPYLPEKSKLEFHELTPDEKIKEIIEECKKFGIEVYFGEWLLEERPRCFLISYENFLSFVNNLKYELWNKYRIDSLRTGDDYNHPLSWCKAVSIFLKIFLEKFKETQVILHLHEWLSGAIILFEDFKIPTIFTIHATVLGRTMAEAGINFWDHLSILEADKEAYKYGVEAKHMIEKHSARKATFFTTISNILAIEAFYILGRKPDYILPNGINIEKFPTIEEINYQHRINREVIKEFLLYFFSPYYKVEFRKSLIFFISGRKEIKNKGIDIFIRSLGILNKKLEEKDPHIYAFLFIPSQVIDVNHTILNNLNIYRNLEEKIEDLLPEIKSRLIHYLIHKEKIEAETLFEKEEFVEIQKIIKQVSSSGDYPLSTHYLDPNDEILFLLKENKLFNRPEDKVKVIYYPIYLRRGDGFLNLSYEEAIIGCHVGLFPSFYEPWGYTPLETASSGVITVTSDLTGFSNYIKSVVEFNKDYPGIYIINRKGKRESDVVEELANLMLSLARLSRAARINNKLEARRIATYCSWDKLIVNYFDLYNAGFNRYQSHL